MQAREAEPHLPSIQGRALRRARLTAAMAALAAVVLATTAGCSAITGPQRSQQAFCKTLSDGTAELAGGARKAYQTGETDPLAGLVTATGNIGRFEKLLDNLADVAPDEIRSDVVTVRDTMKKSIDKAGDAISDPLGALGGSLLGPLIHSSSFEAVDAYARSRCGSSLFGG